MQNIVEDREVMALVYLCDDLTIRAEAAEDSTKVVTVPSGQMVEIRDVTMDEDYQVWEKVSAEVKGKVYVHFFDFTAKRGRFTKSSAFLLRSHDFGQKGEISQYYAAS